MNSRNRFLRRFAHSSICFFVFLFSTFYFLLFLPTTHAATVSSSEIGPSTLYSGLVGWWTFDGKDMLSGTALDKSGNGNTATLINIATSTFYAPGKLGQAFRFDGVDDNISITNGSPFNFTSVSNFTISAWVNPSAVSGGSVGDVIFNHMDGGGNGGYTFAVNGSRQLGATVRDSVGASTVNSNGTVNLNKWTFVTMVFTSTASVSFYINGVNDSSLSFSRNLGTVTNRAQIGNNDNSSSKFFSGLLDDVRIYSRALSATEISQLYNLGSATHVNTTEVGPANLNSGLVGWWTFDGKDMSAGKALDRSGNGNTGTLTNIATSTFYTQGKVGQAFNFDGVDDSVNLGSPSSLNLSGAMTISAWIKASTVAVGAATIFGSYDGVQNIEYAFEFNRTAGRLGFVQGNGGFNLTRKNNTNLVANLWYHVAVVRTGSTGNWTLTFYVNGVSDGAPTETFNPGTLQTVSIGSLGGVSEFSPGTIDGVRVYNRALSATEVSELYNLGTATHVNTTEVGPANLNSGLVGWWTFDGKDMSAGKALDRSGNGNTGTLTNIATSTFYTQGKIGQAFRFDGVDDFINLNSSASAFNFSGGATISCWFKGTSDTANVFYSLTDGNAGNNYHTIYIGGNISGSIDNEIISVDHLSGGVEKLYAFTDATRSDIFNGKWHLITTVYDNVATKIYLDGVSKSITVGKGTNDGNAGGLSSASKLNIGMNDSGGTQTGFLNGSLDDVRVYNRALSATEVQRLYNLGR